MLTGCTGFIGKVLLEKILWSIPKVGKIFLMVRQKRNQTNTERIKQILSSKCFMRCKQARGDNEFMKWALEKIIPVQGDLINEGLGLSAEDRMMVENEVHVIINCAASVNFDDPLHDALNINYFGCLRMLELAKNSKNIQAFCHVSTAYVNCNLSGDAVIDEVIHNQDQEVERMVSKFMQMNPAQCAENLKVLMEGYPNTYTFTKAMAERSILKKRGNLPTCIVRPAMVGPSVKEPFVGWTDTISALSGPIYAGAIGVYNYQVGYGKENVDLVAVDQCCNHILIATTHCAFHPEELHVYNHSSTDVNPIT